GVHRRGDTRREPATLVVFDVLGRLYAGAIATHLDMGVRTGRVASRPYLADLLTCRHCRAASVPGQVCDQVLQTVAVVDSHMIAVAGAHRAACRRAFPGGEGRGS